MKGSDNSIKGLIYSGQKELKPCQVDARIVTKGSQATREGSWRCVKDGI